MEELDEILEGFVKSVEPTPVQKEDARRSHNRLRDLLRTGNMEERILGCYLSGSYSRHTAIAPLDDVDIIILIDHTKWPIGLFSTFPSPRAVLQTFEGAIRYRYPDSGVRAQRRSIGLKLWRMDLDVVPAIPESPESDRIRIPDADRDEWIVSAPKVHKEVASEVNSKQGNLFIPLVKLLKHWNSQLPSTVRLKSFAIETLAVRIFQKVRFDSLFEGALLFFDFIASFDKKAEYREWGDRFEVSLGYWGTPCIPDVAQTGSNLVTGMSEDERSKFISKAIRSRDILTKADNARTWEKTEELLKSALGF